MFLGIFPGSVIRLPSLQIIEKGGNKRNSERLERISPQLPMSLLDNTSSIKIYGLI